MRLALTAFLTAVFPARLDLFLARPRALVPAKGTLGYRKSGFRIAREGLVTRFDSVSWRNLFATNLDPPGLSFDVSNEMYRKTSSRSAMKKPGARRVSPAIFPAIHGYRVNGFPGTIDAGGPSTRRPPEAL